MARVIKSKKPVHFTVSFVVVFIFIASVVITGLYLNLNKNSVANSFAGCPAIGENILPDPSLTVGVWDNHPVNPPLALNHRKSQEDTRVLGVSAQEKWIEVDLTRQVLTAHQGDYIFLSSAISSGLWNRTPAGEYRIWYKIVSTKMEGGSKSDKTYYYLPNVPYAMFFHKDFGIHGTYWHSNFGQRMSHGCVNTPTSVAEKLFYWSQPQLPAGKASVRSSEDNQGTKVIVHY